MAEPRFYKIILNKDSLKEFLISHDLILTPEKIARLNLNCRNANCTNPAKGFTMEERRRNISTNNLTRLVDEGQDIATLMCLRCKSCKTRLSPRSHGYLTYSDVRNRANCKLAPEKVLQIAFNWILQRPICQLIETLDLDNHTIIDWYNFNREICEDSNAEAFLVQLGNGRGRGPNGETPDVVIQIDESLLRGRRLYHRGRNLLGDNYPTLEDRQEWQTLNEEDGAELNPNRNYGRRIEGPWIFGMAECYKQIDGSYITGQVRLFHVERRDAQTLLPIIRENVSRGSMIWSDEWRSYSRIGSEEDGLLHESVNHSQNFVSINGVHTQNIERQWEILKKKILRNMKGTSTALLPTHLHEYMWRSRHNEPIWEKFNSFLGEASRFRQNLW